MDEQKYIVPTKDGVIDDEVVRRFRGERLEELKDRSGDRGTEPLPQINSITANQTQDYFVIATDVGFELIQNDSGNGKLRKKAQNLRKPVALAEMMYRSNIIALVFEAERNNVVIWDDHEKKIRTEITYSADYQILNIKLRSDLLVIVFESKAFVFSFEAFKLIEKVQTSQNAKGLCALS